VAELAARQRGIVTTAQLRRLGFGYDAIALAAQSGRLHRLHRGVYAVGHTALAPLAREQAALTACGAGALLSHASAAGVWKLRELPLVVDVTVAGRRARPRHGVRLHVVEAITAADVRRRHGLPVTAPSRTLVDLAATLEPDALEAALNEAYALKLVTERQLETALARSTGRPGAPALRALLASQQGPAITRSKAERLLRALVRRAGLPMPTTNITLLGYLVDAVWPEQRLVLEVDGYAFHGHRAAFERDRRRDAALIAAGYRVIRVTWRQLTEEPLRVAAVLAQALARAA